MWFLECKFGHPQLTQTSQYSQSKDYFQNRIKSPVKFYRLTFDKR